MFEIEAVLKVKNENNNSIHSYHCPQNTSLIEAHQVLRHMTKIVGDKIEAVKKDQEEDKCNESHEECPEQAKEALSEKKEPVKE